MKPGTIELYAGGMMLLLELFTEGTFPREDLEPTGITISPYGTPATDGTTYHMSIWNLTVLLTEKDAEKLARMYRLSKSQNILIVDRTDRYWEPTQTRAIASGDVAVVEDGMTGYFAQFYGRITQAIKQDKEGRMRAIQLQLTETDKVPIA
jgi:hypothetical protein